MWSHAFRICLALSVCSRECHWPDKSGDWSTRSKPGWVCAANRPVICLKSVALSWAWKRAEFEIRVTKSFDSMKFLHSFFLAWEVENWVGSPQPNLSYHKSRLQLTTFAKIQYSWLWFRWTLSWDCYFSLNLTQSACIHSSFDLARLFGRL